MKDNHPGKRIIQFREHFGLKQGEFSEAIGMVQSNVSKIESGKLGLSNTILYYMMAYYAVNPDWVKTGQGEMLISPEEYLSKGISLLGAKQITEAFIKILKEPEFSETHSYIAIKNITQDNSQNNEEIMVYVEHILKMWHQGDEMIKNWLLVELQRSFREVTDNKK
jgi:transcriptional regulator with XRE-family HTH domain